MLKHFVQKLLIRKVKAVLKKHRPKIVAVTGSVGKTSTRNAIAVVLSGSFKVGKVFENYNNEFGVPLAILGVHSPGRSVSGWLKLLFKRVDAQSYPEVLVLEFGVDHPGDMARLCAIAIPDIAVITAISPVHAENFGSMEALEREKLSLLAYVKEGGRIILNADDERVFTASKQAVGAVTTYGLSEHADLRAKNIRLETRTDFHFEPGEHISTLGFDLFLASHNQHAPVQLNNHLGRPSISAALAAIAVGLDLNLTLDDLLRNLRLFETQNGRLQPIAGIKGSLIIDDSYNAAPASMHAALEVLYSFTLENGARRIAVLGSMAELGSYSEEEHRRLGLRVAELGIDLLITAGEKARGIARGACEAGMAAEHMVECMDSIEAGRKLDGLVATGDIILVKGSQSARMERVVRDVMAQPLLAERLLVRQSAKWLQAE